MRNRVVTWHNTSLNPASRTLILINHRVRSLDTPEEGIPDHLSPRVAASSLSFSPSTSTKLTWEKRLLSVAVLRGPSVNGRGTCSKVQWPQIETHVDRVSIAWKGRKKKEKGRGVWKGLDDFTWIQSSHTWRNKRCHLWNCARVTHFVWWFRRKERYLVSGEVSQSVLPRARDIRNSYVCSRKRV